MPGVQIMNWNEAFFNKLYWHLFMKRTPEEVAVEVAIIKKLLDKKVSTLLDVCCGVGDIAASLETELGAVATGIEFSPDYVNESYIKNMIAGDACILQTDKTFPLVLNWFSSFVYFAPEKNKTLLTNCYNYCEDIFLLESYNPYAVISGFKDEFHYVKEHEGQHYQIERKCHIDVDERMLYQEWVFMSEGQEKSYNTRSYLYFPDELKSLLHKIGFSKVEVMGRDQDKITELGIQTPRLIIKAQK